MRPRTGGDRSVLRRRAGAAVVLGVAAALTGTLLLTAAHGSQEDARGSRDDAQASNPPRLLERAEALLVRDCIAERGFDLPVVDAVTLPADRTFPYVVDDVRWARAHGYGSDVYAQIAKVRQADPVRAYLEGLPDKRRQAALEAVNGTLSDRTLQAKLPNGAVLGRSAESCMSRAQHQLYGDLPTWYQVSKLTDNLPAIWTSEVLADRRYTVAIRDWSACMRKRDFPYATPSEAKQQTLGRPAEIPTAVAEATCAHLSGLSAVVDRLETSYEAAVREKYRSDLRTKERLERAALPRARSIVAAG